MRWRIVVLSPPGRINPAMPSRSAGRRTGTPSTPIEASVWMCSRNAPCKARTPIFTITMKLLNPADSRIPMTRIVVIARMMHTAGRFTIAPVACQPATPHPATACCTWVAVQNTNGGLVSLGGISIPKRLTKLTNVADQPTPTVAAPMAYSRIRSHPMIQATSSPSVAYE